MEVYAKTLPGKKRASAEDNEDWVGFGRNWAVVADGMSQASGFNTPPIMEDHFRDYRIIGDKEAERARFVVENIRQLDDEMSGKNPYKDFSHATFVGAFELGDALAVLRWGDCSAFPFITGKIPYEYNEGIGEIIKTCGGRPEYTHPGNLSQMVSEEVVIGYKKPGEVRHYMGVGNKPSISFLIKPGLDKARVDALKRDLGELCTTNHTNVNLHGQGLDDRQVSQAKRLLKEKGYDLQGNVAEVPSWITGLVLSSDGTCLESCNSLIEIEDLIKNPGQEEVDKIVGQFRNAGRNNQDDVSIALVLPEGWNSQESSTARLLRRYPRVREIVEARYKPEMSQEDVYNIIEEVLKK